MSELSSPVDIVSEVIRGRRTIHNFRPECPSRDVVLRALELARWAPNHHRTEPWRFRWLGPQTVAAIVHLNADLLAARKGPAAGEDKRRRWSAVPGWLVVTCQRSDDPQRAEEDYAACCCAIHNLALALWAEGIGAKWSTGEVTRHPEFYRLIQANPATERVVGLVWYGYPAQVPDQQRKPVTEILTELP